MAWMCALSSHGTQQLAPMCRRSWPRALSGDRVSRMLFASAANGVVAQTALHAHVLCDHSHVFGNPLDLGCVFLFGNMLWRCRVRQTLGCVGFLAQTTSPSGIICRIVWALLFVRAEGTVSGAMENSLTSQYADFLVRVLSGCVRTNLNYWLAKRCSQPLSHVPVQTPNLLHHLCSNMDTFFTVSRFLFRVIPGMHVTSEFFAVCSARSA